MENCRDTVSGVPASRQTLKQRAGRIIFSRMPVTRQLFDQFRRELAGRRISLRNRLSPSRRRRLAGLRGGRDLLVNVASGPFPLPGFVNLDSQESAAGVIGWDCRRALPLSDRSAAGIRVEHFVEHLDPREELPTFLADCLRVLKPGGVLRVIVPDAEAYLRAYCSGDRQAFRKLGVPDPFPADLPTAMDVVNHVFHQWGEHFWGYDFESLSYRLAVAGFREVRRAAFGRSGMPELAQDREQHAPYSLYVDGIKAE